MSSPPGARVEPRSTTTLTPGAMREQDRRKRPRVVNLGDLVSDDDEASAADDRREAGRRSSTTGSM